MAYNWFNTIVKYEKTGDEGKIVKISESYLVDALSFTEAEARIIEEMRPFISGEFITTTIRRARINELFANPNGDRWWDCKVFFISLDEEKGIEKRTASKMMVQANDIDEASAELKKGMAGSMASYVVAGITETPILDVFPFTAPE